MFVYFFVWFGLDFFVLVLFSFPSPSSQLYLCKWFGGPVVSALGAPKPCIVLSHLTDYVDLGSPQTSAKSLDSKRTESVRSHSSVWMAVLLSARGQERMSRLSLPSSTFLSAVMGRVFQCLLLFVCRSVGHAKFRKHTLQNSHLEPCSDTSCRRGLFA